jgi:hypothetical protein
METGIVTFQLSDTMEQRINILYVYEIRGSITGITKPAVEHSPVPVQLTDI